LEDIVLNYREMLEIIPYKHSLTCLHSNDDLNQYQWQKNIMETTNQRKEFKPIPTAGKYYRNNKSKERI
jgi:hypothetical protein